MYSAKKKGILFSLFVVTALSLVVLSFKMKQEFVEEDRAEIFKQRAEQTNFFVADFSAKRFMLILALRIPYIK